MEEEYKKTVKKVSTDFTLGYYKARDAIEQVVETMKDFSKSQSRDLYNTKADVRKKFWKVFEEKSRLKMPPLNEEFIAEFIGTMLMHMIFL